MPTPGALTTRRMSAQIPEDNTNKPIAGEPCASGATSGRSTPASRNTSFVQRPQQHTTTSALTRVPESRRTPLTRPPRISKSITFAPVINTSYRFSWPNSKTPEMRVRMQRAARMAAIVSRHTSTTSGTTTYNKGPSTRSNSASSHRLM